MAHLDDMLQNSAQAAELLKNKQVLQGLLHSADTQRLIQLLSQNAGDGLKTAADAAMQGDTTKLVGLVNQLMSSQEGAAVVSRIQKNIPKK